MKHDMPKRGYLTQYQQKFIHEYLKDFNGTAAAKRAGWKGKTHTEHAFDLLRRPHVQAALLKELDTISGRTGITAERVIRELGVVGFADAKDYLDIDEGTGSIRAKAFDAMPAEASRAIAGVTENRSIKEDAKGEQSVVYSNINFKMHNKVQALELLGKYFLLFRDRLEVTGPKDSELTIKVVKV